MALIKMSQRRVEHGRAAVGLRLWEGTIHHTLSFKIVFEGMFSFVFPFQTSVVSCAVILGGFNYQAELHEILSFFLLACSLVIVFKAQIS